MKTMRYILVFLLSLVFCFGLVAAEKPVKEKKAKKPLPEYEFKRFYVDISVGYAFRLGANEIDGFLNTGIFENITMFDLLDCANVGKGVRVGANFGFNFNRYMGLELNGGYIAFPVDIVSTNRLGRVMISETMDGFARGFESLLFLDAQRGYLSVQMKVNPGFVRCNPYVKAGIGTIFGRLEHEASLATNKGVFGTSDEVLYRAGYKSAKNFFMLGFVGALGIDFYINPMLSFFMEWQAGVYSTSYFNWMDGKQREEGKLDVEFEGDEDVFGNSNGLNLGIKFKF